MEERENGHFFTNLFLFLLSLFFKVTLEEIPIYQDGSKLPLLTPLQDHVWRPMGGGLFHVLITFQELRVRTSPGYSVRLMLD